VPAEMATAVTHAQVRVAGSTAFQRVLRVVAIRPTDQPTVFRAMAWLARRYGAPIPAGY
jgi:hypothetical protein